jgi:hypothetical protein
MPPMSVDSVYKFGYEVPVLHLSYINVAGIL